MGAITNTGKRASADLRPGVLGSLDWTPENARQSLDTIYQHVVDDATGAVNWYMEHKRSNKRWARRLRVGAIILVTIAGVLPVLSQIFEASGSVKIQPAWASVALAAAVALVALDRFFGFSSAWARYVATGQAISAALSQFQLDWQRFCYMIPPGGLTREDIEHLLDLAKALMETTGGLVRSETTQWVKEFRETLAEIEGSAQSRSRITDRRQPVEG